MEKNVWIMGVISIVNGFCKIDEIFIFWEITYNELSAK